MAKKAAKLLFIGGPSDGQTFVTDQKKVTISVKTTQGKGAKNQSTQYIRETLKLGKAKVEVMRWKGWSADNALAFVLDSYKYDSTLEDVRTRASKLGYTIDP